MSMKVESFVNECVNTLDTFEEFDLTDNPALPCRTVTSEPNWTNPTEVEDSIVDRVMRSDDQFAELVEIVRHTLEVYDVEPTDEQIAAEIVNLRFTYIKGIVTEMNYTSYKMKCDDVMDVMDAGDVADYDGEKVKEVEENGIDSRIIYKTESIPPFHEDVQVKSSNSAGYRHRRKDDTEEDVTVYPRDDGWNRLT